MPQVTGSPDKGLSRALDEAVRARRDDAVELLRRLVRCASELGSEAEAQRQLAAALKNLGFSVDLLPIPCDIGDDAAAGVPQITYEGRSVVVARRRPRPGVDGPGRSLIINGHVDVVPPGDPGQWSTDPYLPVIQDGWLVARGAGDMKGGIAMAVLAIGALLDVCGDEVAAELTFVGAIEEECTGNGTLASIRAGVLADAALLPEPSDLELMTSGIGVLWLDADLSAESGHAEAGGMGGVLDGICAVRDALARLEEELNAGEPSRPYRVSAGRVEAGDWVSSVPGTARVRIRVGFPAQWTVAEAEDRVRDCVSRVMDVRWPGDRHRVGLRSSGFRARGYVQERSELLDVLARAHADAHGAAPREVGVNATTDARFYVHEARVPVVCFGPRARGIHGPDEAVELASIEDGARTLARFMARWLCSSASAFGDDSSDWR